MKKRFKQSIFETLNVIIIARYIFDDVRRKHDSINFVFIIIKTIKIIEVSIHNQLYFIYNVLKIKFRRDLTKFFAFIIMNEFLQKLNDKNFFDEI